MPPAHDAVRVRFAPNGEIPYAAFFTRTILYSWLFARRYAGAFVLRLDDTDLDHQVTGAMQSYLSGMRWLGLDWDEGPEVGGDHGPYRQSERLHLYREALDELLSQGRAYRCYCSAERLREVAADARRPGAVHGAYDGRCRYASAADIAAAEREGRRPAIRLRTPDDGVVESHDLLRGAVRVRASEISDFIICRPDGWPTYHLTVVVDDRHMAISHVLRGVEGLSTMAPQALVHQALGFPVPYYLHFPLVRTPGFTIGDRFLPRGRLLYLDELRHAGYFPHAVVNYYANLGYSVPSEEHASLDDLVEEFRYSSISKKEFVNQSLDKLAWMNRTYLRTTAPDRFVEDLVRQRLRDSGVADEHASAIATRSAPVLRSRLAVRDNIESLLSFAVRAAPAVDGADDNPAARHWTAVALEALRREEPVAASLRTRAGPGRDARSDAIRSVLRSLGAHGTPLSLDDVVTVLGPEEATARLRQHARAS
ncbi:glutamate--tRNA ligase [Streptomyces sp. NPDC054847]